MKAFLSSGLPHALARSLVFAWTALPFLLLGLYFHAHREDDLRQLLSGWNLLLPLAATVGAALTLWYHHRLLGGVDRRFFREKYDGRQLLMALVERIRDSSQPAGLAQHVLAALERALHPLSAALLVEDPQQGRLVDPTGKVPALETSSSLAALLAASSQPLEVGDEGTAALLESVEAADRDWLRAEDFRLLVPMVALDGSLVGCIALGERRSRQPFARDDRQLLGAVARAAALALEVYRLRSAGSGQDASHATAGTAQECPQCGQVFLPATEHCHRCERSLEAAPIPYVLPGRFRFERRIGSGGMGVVYRAIDLGLNRPVAIKTIRRVSLEDHLRLRREARAAAAVLHPNLALIYGLESWQGTPLLILEFLERGTLEDRLDRATLSFSETLELGIALAGALEKLHGAGILHRDLKPSNIGFSGDGTPKLVDFGIARLQFDLRREAPSAATSSAFDSDVPTVAWSRTSQRSTQTRQLAGTLHYLSPEALSYQPPAPSFDLWGLNVVLFECLTGERLFGGPIRQVIQSIQEARLADLRAFRSNAPEDLVVFFTEALHRDPERRPPTAASLRGRFEALREAVQEA